MESSKTWNNPHNLTSILQEVLSQEWPESSSRWSITVEDVRTRQVLQATDRVTLRYTIGWPINMILDEEALDKYNALFRFQLKLKWALWTLTNLRFRDLEKSKPMKDEMQHFFARRLESLRFWLMHAIGSIHAYLSGQVLQSLGRALEKRLALADNLDTIITGASFFKFFMSYWFKFSKIFKPHLFYSAQGIFGKSLRALSANGRIRGFDADDSQCTYNTRLLFTQFRLNLLHFVLEIRSVTGYVRTRTGQVEARSFGSVEFGSRSHGNELHQVSLVYRSRSSQRRTAQGRRLL